MNSLLLHIALIAVLFDFIDAIPVPIRSFGERNVALFGVLSCIGIGAVIGMCVFCKKKKGQFKKFENDGNVDAKSTEYPILKSLNSLDTKKTGAIIPSSPTNLSTDNLLEQTVQYQNESVSSHELDGIENYHLLQYQRKKISKTSAEPNVVKKNVPSGASSSVPDDDDFNSNVLLSSKESLSSASPLPATRTSYSLEQETASSKNSTDFGDEKPLIEGSSGARKEGDSEQLDAALQSLTHLEDVTISISGKLTFPKEETSTSAQEYGVPEDVTPMDSLEDNSSIHETNSIEEALRALDIAIDGEDESDENSVDEPSFAGYSIDLDRRDTTNEVANVDEVCNEKNSSSDSGMDEIEISEKVTTPDTIMHEMVRLEATKLVNEVLQVCQSRIEEILECDEKEQPHVVISATEDDFDDFNSGVVLECSTPFVTRKTDENGDFSPTAVKHALFCDDKMDAAAGDSLAEALSIDSDDGCTQIETELAPKEPNVTYQTNINDEIDDLEQIYPASNTVILLPVDKTQTIGSTSFDHAQAGLLPEITVEGTADDAIPDKLTATPMNTPIELGCPTTAEWDKWLSANATGSGISRDVQETAEGDCFSSQTFDEGWFLHAQPGCSSNDNDCNETYDLPDQNDDLDSTYDLLRKQLAEMLPHAQGAKEATGCFDESSGSPGAKGGDLDDVTNEPSTSAAKDNEMIINYKRTLSPIMEESEDESFYNKTSYYKETSNYVESTSTGCMESLTAMGVNKTLMASNDTLFNFEDVLDEILSPRVPSQSHTPTNRDRELMEQRIRSPRHVTLTESTSTNELIPQLARDSSLSSTGDTIRIDFSQDSTFTLDEKTCISLSRPNEEDERISEISEPILVSSSSVKPDDNNSLLDEEIASIEDDSFNKILEKEKPLENEQYNHFLDLRNTVEPMLELDPPEPDENFDPASMLNSTGQEVVYLQNKINLENMYTNRNLDEQVVIESIDRFLLKSRNISLPEDKSTNPLVNGHLSSAKISSRSDAKNICINYDN